ncbi:hypothetical protein [Siccirubricoccus sp. G192]|uniref:hypothetical protein n=1 Tax=Siccirubricoccus sp. G192 TaxID=2849651 RepID=UPI001C2BAB56|nr:hypothetical protein [Siccirubricoccus sp. G192]MBV1798985.1 hypothetical protein [Siccirubricoccus sp. G192]
MVTAFSERAAREGAARALARRGLAGIPALERLALQDPNAAEAAPLSPWLQARLVEILEAPAVTATSLAEALDPGVVLVPRDPGSPVAEYRVLGAAEPQPAAAPPQAAASAKPSRATKPATPAGPRRAEPKAAKPALAARARSGQKSSQAAAGKKAAKPAPKPAKAAGRQASRARAKPRGPVAPPPRPAMAKRGAAAGRSRR